MSTGRSDAIALLLGFGLDRALGDPARAHPVGGFGVLAESLERLTRRPGRRAGLLHVALLVLLVGRLARLAGRRPLWAALVIWVSLGGRTLEREAAAMGALLEAGALQSARAQVRTLVGRDARALEGTELSRATIESVAENTADAVVGALFWGALAGPPGAAVYRAANTLDAMVGHRGPRNERFGWAAARLDDLLTWPAARLAAGLAVLLAPLVGASPREALRIMRRDGHRHPSPNAGLLEATFAGALGIKLGGTNRYASGTEQRPQLGDGRSPGSRRHPARGAPLADRRGGRRCRLRAARMPAPMNGPLADPLRVHGDRFVASGMLDFAVNVWPTERPRRLRDALVEALGCVGYPDERAARLAIARRHARPPAETLPLSGACEGFWVLATALRARHAACVHPSFTEAEAALRAAGTRVTRVLRRADEGWALAPERVPADADLVVLVNPNNPTGNLDRADRIALLARPGRTLVVDESFIDFVGDRAASLAPCRGLPGLVVLRSLTKVWGLAGLRAGYLVGPAPLVERLRGHRQAWSVSAPALAAIETCVPDAETPARIARRGGVRARRPVRTPRGDPRFEAMAGAGELRADRAAEWAKRRVPARGWRDRRAPLRVLPRAGARPHPAGRAHAGAAPEAGRRDRPRHVRRGPGRGRHGTLRS